MRPEALALAAWTGCKALYKLFRFGSRPPSDANSQTSGSQIVRLPVLDHLLDVGAVRKFIVEDFARQFR